MVKKNVTEAKAQLSKLLELAEKGEIVLITRGGKGTWRLTYESQPQKRQMGLAKGQIWISPDFDEIDEEIIQMFEGESD